MGDGLEVPGHGVAELESHDGRAHRVSEHQNFLHAHGSNLRCCSRCAKLPPPSLHSAPTALDHCPDPYVPGNVSYAAGDRVSVHSHVFECRPPPYEYYCGVDVLGSADAGRIEEDGGIVRAREYYAGAWEPVSPCLETGTPTGGPTVVPTGFPTVQPSLLPTSEEPTSAEPTPSPSDTPTDLLICPHPYSEEYAPRYRDGYLVEVSGTVFECKPYPYDYYCTLPDFRPRPGVVHATGPAWSDAWEKLGPCGHPDTDGPSGAPSAAGSGQPSGAPSGMPTCEFRRPW
ncbi:hypothetical protein THAOC_29131 [Thalassiosira oceanica]|uniref:Uncharacterized protein n=1 Tax=Thalassiosira oceanica TaxID=159749 RepID=K0RS16_THAOC|nr:hypothetical protein THAOC_29131 [Thalassiosira oceanica]|eukprot:EJK51676.1 hypothetical protein THAOC_29131 [Thalassiosira oceanica]